MVSPVPKRALLVFLCAAFLAALLSGAQPASGQQARVAPVPSLEPSVTERLWRSLVRRRAAVTPLAVGDCRPLRAVFYAASDWLRLATKLATTPSPCADYSISVPPLVADKTLPRPDQAWRVRALGPSFHALAEISWNAWSAWVAAGSGTWYEAGVEARRRMASAGYDVSLGDSWALNELSSAVRRGDGVARANAREFMRGLYEGDGILPRARGTAFMVGIGQGTTDLTTYKAHLQNWLLDAAFWSDLATYVRDWSQESYGDVRAYAVPGAPLAARRDALRNYLGHALFLARSSPATAAAHAFLQAAYNPLANAAWEWDASFGWTAVPVAEMKDFASAQTYALRHIDPAGGTDRGGFAWAPRNAAALPAPDFAAQTGELLDRLAAAVRDSSVEGDPADPGLGACAPAGVNVWCVAGRAGSSVNAGWGGFAAWTQPAAAFTSAPPTVVAGAVSPSLAVQLQLAGVPQVAPAEVAVELSSSSPTGVFSTGPDGPWSAQLTVAVGAGATTTAGFYYLDSTPGAPTLTARAPGGTATQVAIVQPAPAPGEGGGGGAPGDLVLTGSVEPASAPLGTTVTWRLQLDDRTLQLVSGVYLDIALPAGHAYVGSIADRGPGCALVEPSRLRCSLDFLNAAAPTANVALLTTAQLPGTHVLTATAGFDGTDAAPGDNTVSLQSLMPAPAPPAPPAEPRRLVKRGSARADVLVGGGGPDLLTGRGGNDVLRGLAGADRLDGGAGGDLLAGGSGPDRIAGGLGDDLVRARDGRRDAVVCGPGRDRVVADRADQVGASCEHVARR
jgi:hypothetical protein